MALLLESDRDTAARYVSTLGGEVKVLDTWPALTKEIDDHPDEVLVVIGPDAPIESALAFAEAQRLARPALGVVLLRRRVDVKVLGAALRAGVREVVMAEDLQALADASSRSMEISRRTAGWQPGVTGQPEGKIVTVFAAKGGCGKTTMSTNLAATLAGGGRRSVCLVDLDLAFGDVAITMQLFPTRSLSDAATMGDKLDEAGVRSLLTPHSPGLDTLLAPLEPGDAEKIPTAVVSELLSVLRRMFDFVIVDTPPAFTEAVLAALDVSDSFVLLATLDIPALKNLRLTLDMLDLLGYSRDSWKILLNRADSKVGLDVNDVEKTLKTPIAAQIPSSRAVSTSINRGVPLVLDQPNHPVSQALRTFADTHLLAGVQAEDVVDLTTTRPVQRRGFSLRRKVAAR